MASTEALSPEKLDQKVLAVLKGAPGDKAPGDVIEQVRQASRVSSGAVREAIWRLIRTRQAELTADRQLKVHGVNGNGGHPAARAESSTAGRRAAAPKARVARRP
jgi:hypothetical protein